MVTKLKNSLYSGGAKFLCIIIMIGAFMVVSYSFMNIINIVNNQGLFEEAYVSSSSFHNDYNRLSHNVAEKYLRLVDEAYIKNVTLDSTYVKTQWDIDQEILRLKTIEKNLEAATSFRYLLVNTVTGKQITNITEDDPLGMIISLPTCVYYEGDLVNHPGNSLMGVYGYRRTINMESQLRTKEGILDEHWRLYTAVTDPITQGDVFFDAGQNEFERYKIEGKWYLLSFGIAVLVALLCLIYLFVVMGKKKSDSKVVLLVYDEIPQEIQCIITCLFVVPLGTYSGYYYSDSNSQVIVASLLMTVIMIGMLIQYTSIVRLIKAKQLFKKLLVYRILKGIYTMIKIPKIIKGYKLKVLFGLGGIIFFNIIMLIFTLGAGDLWAFLILIVLVVDGVIVYKAFRVLDSLGCVMTVIHKRRAGEVNEPIEVDKLDYFMKEFGEDLEQLQDGLNVAIKEAVRGEKLKTELITNVTHDLKNPLTSIINYVELLKSKGIEDDKATEYITILEEKATRLKTLIEQLVDAAKASSGQVEIDIVEVDVKQLLRQLLGEHDKEIKEKKLACVLSETKEPVMIQGDRIILYRIIENLLSNAIKYSQENTRIYMDISIFSNTTELTIKNISKDPLNMKVEDLTRRFVRGDSSRSTEGSGLGLSIALSLANLIKAKLLLEIDGDLFKATLAMPNCENNQELVNSVLVE